MTRDGKVWKVKDKSKLLLVMMTELAGDAHISFEGNLSGLTFVSIAGASEEPTAVLKRNTLSPKQDFVVVPLEPSTVKQIVSAIGGAVPRTIIHIQIEKNGLLEFGAYDNFHPECIYFGSLVKEAVMDLLISGNVVKPSTLTT